MKKHNDFIHPKRDEMPMSSDKWDYTWEFHYKKIANTLKEKNIQILFDERNVRYFEEYVGTNHGLTLEVGAGSSRVSALLAKRGFQTYCLDFSDSALKLAMNNYHFLNAKGWFIKGDAFQLPFKDNTFSCVLSTGLLEHFEDPLPIVKEMVRVLSHGGVFYSDIIPKKFSLFRSLDWISVRRILYGSSYKSIHDKIRNEFFEMPFTLQDIRDFLNKCDLHDVRVFPAHVSLPRKMFPPTLRMEGAGYYFHKALAPLFKRLDDTFIASKMGFAYIAFGRKR